MISVQDDDRSTADFFLREHAITREQLQESLDYLENLRTSGVQPLPSLERILLHKGFLLPPPGSETERRAGMPLREASSPSA